jgi:hypothetical protein
MHTHRRIKPNKQSSTIRKRAALLAAAVTAVACILSAYYFATPEARQPGSLTGSNSKSTQGVKPSHEISPNDEFIIPAKAGESQDTGIAHVTCCTQQQTQLHACSLHNSAQQQPRAAASYLTHNHPWPTHAAIYSA